MLVVQAAGYGGGSLVYANVQMRPPADLFAAGWPSAYSRPELDPYYDLVAHMPDVAQRRCSGPSRAPRRGPGMKSSAPPSSPPALIWRGRPSSTLATTVPLWPDRAGHRPARLWEAGRVGRADPASQWLRGSARPTGQCRRRPNGAPEQPVDRGAGTGAHGGNRGVPSSGRGGLHRRRHRRRARHLVRERAAHAAIRPGLTSTEPSIRARGHRAERAEHERAAPGGAGPRLGAEAPSMSRRLRPLATSAEGERSRNDHLAVIPRTAAVEICPALLRPPMVRSSGGVRSMAGGRARLPPRWFIVRPGTCTG
jgi:hypothetical protein